jgi:hypothetical protein
MPQSAAAVTSLTYLLSLFSRSNLHQDGDRNLEAERRCKFSALQGWRHDFTAHASRQRHSHRLVPVQCFSLPEIVPRSGHVRTRARGPANQQAPNCPVCWVRSRTIGGGTDTKLRLLALPHLHLAGDTKAVKAGLLWAWWRLRPRPPRRQIGRRASRWRPLECRPWDSVAEGAGEKRSHTPTPSGRRSPSAHGRRGRLRRRLRAILAFLFHLAALHQLMRWLAGTVGQTSPSVSQDHRLVLRRNSPATFKWHSISLYILQLRPQKHHPLPDRISAFFTNPTRLLASPAAGLVDHYLTRPCQLVRPLLTSTPKHLQARKLVSHSICRGVGHFICCSSSTKI